MMAKKNHALRIRVSKEQYDAIKKKAEDSLMTISTFIRYIALNINIERNLE